MTVGMPGTPVARVRHGGAGVGLSRDRVPILLSWQQAEGLGGGAVAGVLLELGSAGGGGGG